MHVHCLVPGVWGVCDSGQHPPAAGAGTNEEQNVHQHTSLLHEAVHNI